MRVRATRRRGSTAPAHPRASLPRRLRRPQFGSTATVAARSSAAISFQTRSVDRGEVMESSPTDGGSAAFESMQVGLRDGSCSRDKRDHGQHRVAHRSKGQSCPSEGLYGPSGSNWSGSGRPAGEDRLVTAVQTADGRLKVIGWKATQLMRCASRARTYGSGRISRPTMSAAPASRPPAVRSRAGGRSPQPPTA